MLESIRKEHTRDPITAVFIQDTNSSNAIDKNISNERGENYSSSSVTDRPNANARNGQHTDVAYGGTAIIQIRRSIDEKESLDAARERITATAKRYSHGRTTTVNMKVRVSMKLVSAYALADGARGIDRPTYFKHPQVALTRNTILDRRQLRPR